MSDAVYMIVIQAPSDTISYGIPSLSEISTVAFTSYTDAKTALMDMAEKFEDFRFVAYGEAYPYENTTFEKDLSTKNYALIGWIPMEEDETITRLPVGLLKIPIQHSQQASS